MVKLPVALSKKPIVGWLFDWSQLSLKFITEYLGMRKVFAKMVPRLLTDDQEDRYLQVGQDILERLQTKSDLLRIAIFGDDTKIWVHPDNLASEKSVEDSEVAESKESKIVRDKM